VARQALRAHFAVPDLSTVGLRVVSAGTHGLNGHPATGEIRAVAAEMGLDLSDHQAVRVDRAMLEGGSLIYAMEIDQIAWLQKRFPGPPVGLLGQSNIDDPYGQSLTEYRRAGREIAEAIRLRTPEMIALAS
jgi:protein-tyrosine-phosphatase